MHSMLLILDANFILLPVQFGIDIYDLLPLTVPESISTQTLSPVVDEIQKKMEMEPIGSKFKRDANTALNLFYTKSNKVIQYKREPGLSVDDTILKFAVEELKKGNSVCVATNDKKLKDKLLQNNIHVVILRARKTLQFI